MKFVKFTTAGSEVPILVNLDYVQSIFQDGNGSTIAFQDEDDCITIKESIAEVTKRVQEAQDGKVRFY